MSFGFIISSFAIPAMIMPTNNYLVYPACGIDHFGYDSVRYVQCEVIETKINPVNKMSIDYIINGN